MSDLEVPNVEDLIPPSEDLEKNDMEEIGFNAANVSALLNATTLDFDQIDFFTETDLEGLSDLLRSGNLTQADLQEFLRQPRVDTENGCPLGFICGREEMANCTRVRMVAVIYGFGDIHAGSFCPEGSIGLEHCPVGFYCESPEIIKPCPKGYFCPHKTDKFEIVCAMCGEAETELKRDFYGTVVILFIVFALLCYAIISTIRRYKKEVFEEFKEKVNRQFNPAYRAHMQQEEQQRLDKIRPKLDTIYERILVLRPVSPESPPRRDDPLRFNPNGTIHYNPHALFDTLDRDRNGYLNYDELRQVIGLNNDQHEAFVLRLRELGGESNPDPALISRDCFVRHFLAVLEETTNFGPTQEEAGNLFDTLDLAGKGYILASSLYFSKLTTFLTDPQINQMIKLFRRYEGPDRSRRASGTFPASSRFDDRGAYNFASFFGDARRETSLSNRDIIKRSTFSMHYPTVLQEVVRAPVLIPSIRPDSDREGTTQIAKPDQIVDLAFENLCLTVTVGDGKQFNVVNNVSGRIQAGTMGALMGGSGAGKTSLLNALCGRAYYGKTTGKIYVNGHETHIEDHRGVTGFVPQDDIVYAELTVKECLMFAGRFTSKPETSEREIEDLADATIANLGLSRVANAIVGDVNRRGVSGGEKKRVNIGVELMSRPAILFLDEPTSGLDSSSAWQVMSSMKNLTRKQGVTVLSVIHQPRKMIFDLFDSLTLLGAGGYMVYHGPVSETEAYFGTLPKPYRIPPGESLADWLIDISTGMIEPEEPQQHPHEVEMRLSYAGRGAAENAQPTEKMDAQQKAKLRREALYECWKQYFASLQGKERDSYAPPSPFPFPTAEQMPSFRSQLKFQLQRLALISWRNRNSKIMETVLLIVAVTLVSALEGTLELTKDHTPDIHFVILTSGNPILLARAFPELFMYALNGIAMNVQYAMKVGVLPAMMIGLMAAKMVTEKRLEFFREAGSGYNIDAYFIAINLFGILEHSFQMVLAGAVAFWLRSSITAWYAYVFNFWILMWLAVSWSLLLSLVFPPTSVVLAVGSFVTFFGLLFAGGLPPVQFIDLYDDQNPLLGIFSGFVSVTRYFIESMVVQEYRCMPQQSGFTIHDLTVTYPMVLNSFSMFQLAQNDESVVRRSCSGWYWSFWPAFCVGLTVRFVAYGAIHTLDRSKQAKHSLKEELEAVKPLYTNPMARAVFIYVVVLLMLFTGSVLLMQKSRGSNGLPDPEEHMNATILEAIEQGADEITFPVVE